VTNGPDAIPASQPTATTLNNAVVALASKSQAPTSAGGSSTNVPAAPTGAGTVSGTGAGTGSGSGGGTDSSNGPIQTPSTPGINLPGGSGGGGTGPGHDQVNGTVDGVNNALGGIDTTLNGLLGR
jgi:hypothetical protein